MLMKTTLIVSTKLYNTHVKVTDNIEFNIERKCDVNFIYTFHICNRKGDFKIVKVTDSYDNNLSDSEDVKSFSYDDSHWGQLFNFYILADVEFKKIDLVEKTINVSFSIPHQNMQKLNVFEYYEDSIVLPQCENKKVKYLVMKNSEGWIEVVAGLPGDETIDFQNMFFKHVCSDEVDCEIKTCCTVYFQGKNSSVSKNSFVETTPPPRNESLGDISLYEILKESKYSDVILIASDSTEIPSYRSVLAKNSKIFEKIFDESTEIPVKINMEGFDADTISSSIDFCYGNKSAIVGKEFKVFKFAEKYDINVLKVWI
uniref:BTB domain-containing protein n=1 Tax=Panagrolaimus davidi TaxID=227884 RepID=A0A914PVG5_9BILA